MSLYNTKSLEDIPEEIEGILIKTFKYNFKIEYIQGKDNAISDFLSRNPVWKKSINEGAYITDEFGREISIDQHVNAAQTIDRFENRFKEDPLLEIIRDAGSMDEEYTAIVKALREGRSTEDIKKSATTDPCRAFLNVWDNLGLLDNKDPTLITMDIKRLVIP